VRRHTNRVWTMPYQNPTLIGLPTMLGILRIDPF
jgi:hypothetical protein